VGIVGALLVWKVTPAFVRIVRWRGRSKQGAREWAAGEIVDIPHATGTPI
jgi:hypothetical protein